MDSNLNNAIPTVLTPEMLKQAVDRLKFYRRTLDMQDSRIKNLTWNNGL